MAVVIPLSRIGEDDILQKKILIFMHLWGYDNKQQRSEQTKCIRFHLLEDIQALRMEITQKSQTSFMKISEDPQTQIRLQKLNKEDR